MLLTGQALRTWAQPACFAAVSLKRTWKKGFQSMQSKTSSSGKSSYTTTPVLFGFGGALPGSAQSTYAFTGQRASRVRVGKALASIPERRIQSQALHCSEIPRVTVAYIKAYLQALGPRVANAQIPSVFEAGEELIAHFRILIPRLLHERHLQQECCCLFAQLLSSLAPP